MKFLRTTAIGCLFLVSPILYGTAWSGGAPVSSTPKGAMKALLEAMHRADAADVKAISINADPQLIDLMCALSTATAKSRDAATAKFGDAAKDVFPDNWTAAGKGVDQAQVKEEDDTATLASAPNTFSGAIRLKKIDGIWKVDFASIPGMADAAAMRSMTQKMVDANDEVADEIKAGKYATAQNAAEAVTTKMAEAMGSATATTQK